MKLSAFWKGALERAEKSVAQSAIATIGVGGTTSLFDVDVKTVAGVGLLTGALSLLTSVASRNIGGDAVDGSPSLVDDRPT